MTRNFLLLAIIAATLVFAGVLILNKIIMEKLSWPLKGKVTSKFGERIHPITGKKSGHNGIDIAVPIGTPIKAPAAGTVLNVYFNTAGGNQLIIKHDNGFRTGYAHLDKSLVKVGDRVKQGQEVALSGNTGGSTGPHLHFTVTNAKGAKVDPLGVLV